MSLLQKYRERIENHFNPDFLEIKDESMTHHGHEGASGAGPISHLFIKIQAKNLALLPVVKQHQAIYGLFQKELDSGDIHAFRIEVLEGF